MIKISQAERNFIISGVKSNMRQDGRTCLDFRTFSIETGVIEQTNGSARVRLGNRGGGTTDVLVGVKVEIGEPDGDFPEQGRLEVHVECAPSASPEFFGSGGSSSSTEYSATLEMALRNVIGNQSAASESDNASTATIDWRALCIIPGKQCWVVYVDCLVLDSDGNLFDALSMGMRAALFNTRIPKIQVLELEDGGTEIEVSDDPNEFTRISTENIPVTVTMAKLGSQGSYVVVDPTLEEELCMETRLTIAINIKGNIVSIQKGGIAGGVNPSELNRMLQSAKRVGVGLLQRENELLKK